MPPGAASGDGDRSDPPQAVPGPVAGRGSVTGSAVPARVVFTPAANALLRRLREAFGPLIFHLSGGCCEGTAPMCFRRSDFRVGPGDVLLGLVDGCPFYVGAAQFRYWAYCQVTVDVTVGGGDSFSLEAADGVRFTAHARLFTDREAAALDAAGPPPTGPEAVQAAGVADR